MLYIACFCWGVCVGIVVVLSGLFVMASKRLELVDVDDASGDADG